MSTNREGIIMKIFTLIALISLGFLSSGCSVKQPMNVTEFKQMVPESMFGKSEQVEVKNSLKKIAKTFKKRADQCLKVSIRRQSCYSTGYGGRHCSTTVMHYKPTVLVSKKKVELHVQVDVEGAIQLSEVPDGGAYTLVADVLPVSKNRSRLELYYGLFGSDIMVKAIKGWASGKSKGCPDLAGG